MSEKLDVFAFFKDSTINVHRYTNCVVGLKNFKLNNVYFYAVVFSFPPPWIPMYNK